MKKTLAFVMTIGLILGLIYAQPALADKQGRAEDKNFAAGTFMDKDLVGVRVLNARGEDLGRITGLAIDPRDGRVAFGVLTYGGFWGFGVKHVAVPLTAMDFRTKKNGRPDRFVLDVSRQQLADAPTFEGGSMPDQKQIEKSYRFFGQSPYWTESTREKGFDFSIRFKKKDSD